MNGLVGWKTFDSKKLINFLVFSTEKVSIVT